MTPRCQLGTPSGGPSWQHATQSPSLAAGVDDLPELLFLFPELSRRVAGCKIIRLGHQAELDFSLPERRPLEPFQRLVTRLHLPHPEARNELLGLGERAVDHGALRPLVPDLRTFRAR